MKHTPGQEESEEGKKLRSGTRTSTEADVKKAKEAKREQKRIRHDNIIANEEKGYKKNAANNKVSAKVLP